ncbi:MAG: hypothetical protein ACOYW4_10695 [Bacillota bacterium]
MAGKAGPRRYTRILGIGVHALLVAAVGSVALTALQLADFTPVPSVWSLIIPVIAAVSIGVARMSVHEVIGCVAVVTIASPLVASFFVTLPTSFLERAAVIKGAIRGAIVADGLFLLPCILAGILLGRWIGGLSEYRAKPATWKR